MVNLLPVIPARADDSRVRDEVVPETEFRDEALPVFEDFRLGDEVGGPVGVELVREGVPVTGDIRCAARISIILRLVLELAVD